MCSYCYRGIKQRKACCRWLYINEKASIILRGVS
nr:MAG TPA: hypothetical protein [Caudoviricetes sp.]DAT48281.1 MAG TPA: hypothetical protein [Caudoviricetes sp.]